MSQTQGRPDPLILSHGPDPAAAQALASACAVAGVVAAFDARTLDQALLARRRCVVVWSDPRATLASALRRDLAPNAAAAGWTAFATSLLARLATAKGNLILVDENSVRTRDNAGLGQVLPLIHDLPPLANPAPGDTEAVLAALMLPHLPDLQAAWQAMRAASLPRPGLSNRTNPSRPGDTPDLIVQERDLLRAQLLALANAVHGMANPPDPSAADRHARSQATEIALLRDQLLALTSLVAVDDGPPKAAGGPAQPDAAFAVAERQAEEIRLLHDLLSCLEPGRADPPDPGSPNALTRVEAAIATLLAELVQETDRRILAEREALSARTALRSLGLDAVTPPNRNAVPPRPST